VSDTEVFERKGWECVTLDWVRNGAHIIRNDSLWNTLGEECRAEMYLTSRMISSTFYSHNLK